MVHVVATEYIVLYNLYTSILLVAIMATMDTVAIVGRVDTHREDTVER